MMGLTENEPFYNVILLHPLIISNSMCAISIYSNDGHELKAIFG